MKTALICAAILAIIGSVAGYFIGTRAKKTPDPIVAIVTQVRTRAVIDHERWISVWYRACPKARGVNPKMLVTWAGRLNYKIPLDSLSIKNEVAADGKTTLRISAPPIEINEPTVPTDWIDGLSTTSMLGLGEAELLAREKLHASPIARYLTQFYLRADDAKAIETEMRKQLDALIADLAGVLGMKNVAVVTTIAPQSGPITADFPKLELCAGTKPVVNGIPLAIQAASGVLQGSESGVGIVRRFGSNVLNAAPVQESEPFRPKLSEPYGSVWFYD